MYGGRYMRLQALVEQTIDQLYILHSVSNFPSVHITKDGLAFTTDIRVWLNDDAKASYDLLQKRLIVLLREQEKLNAENTHNEQ
jgi:hypothetical protein